MKLSGVLLVRLRLCVAPARERGLKCPQAKSVSVERKSRSREGAWIEIYSNRSLFRSSLRRSREGAWIEIDFASRRSYEAEVAPARERGLKFKSVPSYREYHSRSREGAWIEIAHISEIETKKASLPRGSVD